MAKIITKTHYKGAHCLPQKGESVAKHFSDAEIRRRAEADPDAQPLTTEQLVKFRRVKPFTKKR